MSPLSALLFLLPLAGARGVDKATFKSWAQEHGKRYKSTQAERKAFETFATNHDLISLLNADPSDSAVYGHTQFSDLTPEEFRATFFPGAAHQVPPAPESLGGIEFTDSFDWRDYGAVTPVKDQGGCGSCWAHSAVQAVESAHYLKHNSTMSAPVSLSVEQLVECDDHDYACYGGWPRNAFDYLVESDGLVSEADYPYVVDGHVVCLANQTFNETCGDGMCDDPPLNNYCDLTCSVSKYKPVATVASWDAIPTDETAIAAYLALNNPLSVSIDAGTGLSWMQFYKRGVASPKFCSKTSLNHAVFMVGFGTDDGKDYWSVKNSWGEKWGENGYFRIVRGKGACGINTKVVSPTVG